jgi:hypothetical protein
MRAYCHPCGELYILIHKVILIKAPIGLIIYNNIIKLKFLWGRGAVAPAVPPL